MRGGRGPLGQATAGGGVAVGSGCLWRRWWRVGVVAAAPCSKLGPSGPILTIYLCVREKARERSGVGVTGCSRVASPMIVDALVARWSGLMRVALHRGLHYLIPNAKEKGGCNNPKIHTPKITTTKIFVLALCDVE